MLHKLLSLANSAWVWAMLALWGLAYVVFALAYVVLALYRWIM